MRHTIIVVASFLSAGCAGHIDPASASASVPVRAPAPIARADANQRVDSLAEAYFDAFLALNPTFATFVGEPRYNARYSAGFEPRARDSTRALVAEYETRLRAVDRSALDESHRITYDVFRRSLANQRLGQQFPGHLLPLNQFFNFTASFAQLGSGTGLHRRVRTSTGR